MPTPTSGAGVDPGHATDRGIRVLQVSFLILLLTAGVQAVVVSHTGSAGLLSDTLHNLVDACATLPLWLAFSLGRRRGSAWFPYGFRRAEDLAGAAILLLILGSGGLAAYQSIQRIYQPAVPRHLPWALGAALIGFFGNEAVARYRIRVGRAIGSVALKADGQHARWDGITSLAAAGGLVGVLLGFPLADPLAGLLISGAIFVLLRQVGPEVAGRLMDSMDPKTLEEIRTAAASVAGVRSSDEVRARWLGHEIHAELSILVDGSLTVTEGHRIAEEVRDTLVRRIPHLREAWVHVDPAGPDPSPPHDGPAG